MALENLILKDSDFYSKYLKIGIAENDIIDKINAFDWLELSEAKTIEDFNKIIESVFVQFKFKNHKKFNDIIRKAFYWLFAKAVIQVKESIDSIHASYNIDGSKSAFSNEVLNKFYYIEYWANKKNIPVNYNEKDQNKRELFNLDTILLTILSDKLNVLNDYERNKPKK